MKTIRLPATMSLFEIDKRIASMNCSIIRFLVGREAKKRNGLVTRPERAHTILVKPNS